MQPSRTEPPPETLFHKANSSDGPPAGARLEIEVSRVLGMDEETRQALRDLVRGAATRRTAVVGRFLPDEGVSRMLAGHGISEEVAEEDFHRYERVAIPRCGVPLADKRRWERAGVRIEDFTARAVRRAQVSLALLRLEGAQGLVIGRHDDPESLALAAAAPGVRILEDTTDTARLRFSPAFGAVCQTTLSPRRVKWLAQQLHMRWRDARVTFLDTTSPAMKAREEALEAILPRCGHAVIVGSPGEATSAALWETAMRRGVPASVVSGARDLDAIDLGGVSRVALTAGGAATDDAVRSVATGLRRLR